MDSKFILFTLFTIKEANTKDNLVIDLDVIDLINLPSHPVSYTSQYVFLSV